MFVLSICDVNAARKSRANDPKAFFKRFSGDFAQFAEVIFFKEKAA